MAVTIKEDCHLKVKLAGHGNIPNQEMFCVTLVDTPTKKGVKWLWLCFTLWRICLAPDNESGLRPTEADLTLGA